ncbi:MAG: deoxyribodipyrimidine photolyase [Euryarchaeota archaeon]|nr:deoxyribodipyrimidine photolyase [Euryarchaeota archaeon]
MERWHFVAYDQLNQELLPEAEPESLGLIFIETSWKAKQLPYHKQKLALQLSNQRHFALEMQQLGHPVRYIFSEEEYSVILADIGKEYPIITVTKPAELTLRKSISNLVNEGKVKVLQHKGWLTTSEDFISSVGDSPPWRMDKFYRHLRKSRGIMLDGDGKPVGGSWSLDDQNRLPWDGAVELPSNPEFKPDKITTEVIQMIEEKYSHHPGKITPSNLPASNSDANQLWEWAKSSVMHWFGPYEDAMTQEHKTLFHTTVSSLLNLNRLMPKTLLDDTLKLEIPLNSKEGFVRQIIGWREFVRHVHELTDGFEIESEDIPARNGAGWEGVWSKSRITPNVLENNVGLPPTYWGQKSGMLCLDTAVSDVVETGYAHHIPRLMVLANIGNLLGINPRELTDWFWAMFTDAYDWVVEPNVLAMGTYAVGDVMTTKPYVSGTPYIKKMGDYCGDCSLHFKKSCPISDMYWNFLEENQIHFAKNHRMAMPMRTLSKRTQQAKDTAREVTEYVRTQMSQGMELDPEILEGIKA